MEELLSKYFLGEASVEEAREVEEWRGANRANAEEYLEMRRVWLASGKLEQSDQAAMADILSPQEEQDVRVVPLWNQRPFQVAAGVVLLIAAIFAVIKVATTPPPYGEVVAEVTEYVLPDGSQVTLQRGASITIDDFKVKRNVQLNGKAFFEVEPDEDKPFVVATTGAMVEVLGTSFMVNTTEESGLTEVMVSTGEVSFAQNPQAFKGKSMNIRLKPGEMGKLVIGKRGIQKKKISDENFLSWKTKELSFRREPLKDVADKFLDVYGVELRLQNPQLKYCKLSAQFKDKEPEEVVDIIAQTFGLNYQKSEADYVLIGEVCK